MRHPMKKKGNSEQWRRMGVSFFGILLGMAMIIGMLSVMGKKAKAADGDVYNIENGNIDIVDNQVVQGETVETFTEITITGNAPENTVSISASENTEVVVTIKDLTSATIVVRGKGNVTLLVEGTNVVKAVSSYVVDGLTAGIQKENSGKLTIDGNGTLETVGYSPNGFASEGGAGIGGGRGKSASYITITGNVTVKAQGGAGSAGIGGGNGQMQDGESNGSYITISGNAKVTAVGGEEAAGIGGGDYGEGKGTYITITDNAEVTATGVNGGAGIGGGRGESSRSEGAHITISGHAQVIASTIVSEGILNTEAAGIGGGRQGVGHDIKICEYAVVEATGGYWGAGIGGCGADGYSIEISGNADVTATGGSCGAGIGGGNEGEGNGITISESAKVTATGGNEAAGIGGGNNKSGHDITISDNATVIATGVKYGAGIGGGCAGKGEKITVKGSATVIAIGGSAGAGIGGGIREIGEEIKIQDKAVVTVSGGKDTVIIDGIKYHVGYGAAIGTGSSADESYNPIDGTELPLNKLITSEFAGDIRYYQHGTTAKEILEGTATRENCVTITFDANGGEGTMEPAVVTINLPKALPANAFTIAGHSIDKWTVNKDGSGDSYKDEEKVAFAANTTLYVQWSDHVFENTVDEDCLVSGPTCTKGSVYYKSCKCGEKSTETFEAEDALGHEYKVVEGSAVDPTCTKVGKEADRKCSRCDATITGKEIAAAGHKWKAATGAAPKTCEVCGLTEGDVISYIPTGGSTIEWESGDITLTFKRSEQDELCFANYKETQIDKKTTKVSAKAGSTIITIDEATLKALGAGEHTITVVFADATSDVKLVIKEPEVTEPEVKPTEPEKVESPKTGDGLPMGVVTAMALVALLGAAAVTVQRRRGAAK